MRIGTTTLSGSSSSTRPRSFASALRRAPIGSPIASARPMHHAISHAPVKALRISRRRASGSSERRSAGAVRREFREEEQRWRRRRDSNPRYGNSPYGGLANRWFQPLTHVSEAAPDWEQRAIEGGNAAFNLSLSRRRRAASR